MRALAVLAAILVAGIFGCFAGIHIERISWHKERNYLAAQALDKGIDLFKQRHKKCEETSD